MEFIALNKRKLISILLGSMAFFALGAGLYHFSEPLTAALGSRVLPIPLRTAGMLGMFMFALSGGGALPRLLDAKHGLVLDREGFLDNSNAVAAGRVRWEHVTAIRERQQGKTMIAVIMVDNAKEVIDEAEWYARIALRANLMLAGSPVAIVAGTLDCTHEELIQKLQARWKAWQKVTEREAA